MTATDRAVHLARTAAQAAADRMASDIVLLDVSERLVITDAFVLATGSNERAVDAIVDAVEEALLGQGAKPVRREGIRSGRWVLLDFLDVVVHVQHAEERTFYALERLWRDCPVIPWVDADAERAKARAAVAAAASSGSPLPARLGAAASEG